MYPMLYLSCFVESPILLLNLVLVCCPPFVTGSKGWTDPVSVTFGIRSVLVIHPGKTLHCDTSLFFVGPDNFQACFTGLLSLIFIQLFGYSVCPCDG